MILRLNNNKCITAFPRHHTQDNILLKSSLQLFYPYRLHIMNILFKENEITFGELIKRLDISEGSLHNHFRYLEKDKIVTYRKEF